MSLSHVFSLCVSLFVYTGAYILHPTVHLITLSSGHRYPALPIYGRKPPETLPQDKISSTNNFLWDRDNQM